MLITSIHSTPDGLEFFTCVSLKYDNAPCKFKICIYWKLFAFTSNGNNFAIATMSMMSNVALADYSGIPHGGINSLVI